MALTWRNRGHTGSHDPCGFLFGSMFSNVLGIRNTVKKKSQVHPRGLRFWTIADVTSNLTSRGIRLNVLHLAV